jgi:hypothetical protein
LISIPLTITRLSAAESVPEHKFPDWFFELVL